MIPQAVLFGIPLVFKISGILPVDRSVILPIFFSGFLRKYLPLRAPREILPGVFFLRFLKKPCSGPSGTLYGIPSDISKGGRPRSHTKSVCT